MFDKFTKAASKSIFYIVTDDESRIYAYEPEMKDQSTVCAFQFEEIPTKVTRFWSVVKQIVAYFFIKAGHVATVPLENQKTANLAWYTTICLPKIFNESRETDPERRIILHLENSSSDTSHQTSEYLATLNIELMTYPPHSPDLAPKDFFPFPRINDKLHGQRVSSSEKAVEAFKSHVLSISSSDWQKSLGNWFERMHKGINLKGK
jgi:histone-lysine N-methyltransferase SETMAR